MSNSQADAATVLGILASIAFAPLTGGASLLGIPAMLGARAVRAVRDSSGYEGWSDDTETTSSSSSYRQTIDFSPRDRLDFDFRPLRNLPETPSPIFSLRPTVPYEDLSDRDFRPLRNLPETPSPIFSLRPNVPYEDLSDRDFRPLRNLPTPSSVPVLRPLDLSPIPDPIKTLRSGPAPRLHQTAPLSPMALPPSRDPLECWKPAITPVSLPYVDAPPIGLKPIIDLSRSPPLFGSCGIQPTTLPRGPDPFAPWRW